MSGTTDIKYIQKHRTEASEVRLCRFHPFIDHQGPQREQRYNSTLFLTSELEGGEGSASRAGRTLPPVKTRYPLYRRLDGPQDRSGQVRKFSPPPGFDPRTVQPVGSRYTDYATRPTEEERNPLNIIAFSGLVSLL